MCRTDATKDDKFGTLSSSHCGLVELAAAVLYRVTTPLSSHCGTCLILISSLWFRKFLYNDLDFYFWVPSFKAYVNIAKVLLVFVGLL